MSLVSENIFIGLWQGPIDHNASSVVNAIFDTSDLSNFGIIGDSVFIQTSLNGLLPEVNFVSNIAQEFLFYGILVGGDKKGIYPDSGDIILIDDKGPEVVALSGDGVRVCTQGRCIASIDNEITSYNVGDPLKAEQGGDLILATSGSLVVARALQKLDQAVSGVIGYMAVDLQREEILP